MKVLLLSDVHANLQALDTVLEAAQDGFEECWVLGDAIGYGPQPNECLRRIADLGATVVAGNHELVVSGADPVDRLNSFVQMSVNWTREQLTPDSMDFITRMPSRVVNGVFTLVHGSPRDPGWEYIRTPADGITNLEYFDTPGCLIGHTHEPHIMLFDSEARCVQEVRSMRQIITLDSSRFYLNPGSVGMPRDGDPRAAFAILDTGAMTVDYKRCEYDFRETQRLMKESGAHPALIRQVESGRGRSYLERLMSARGRRFVQRLAKTLQRR